MYGSLAAVYDRLSTTDYSGWADFLERIFSSGGRRVRKVLDLACGTGNIAYELAKRNYQVVGADLSEEMLAVAETKLRPFQVPLYKVDMREMPPLDEFDAVVCLSDSFNYLTQPVELTGVFSRLNKISSQLLVFDLNTPHYLSSVLGKNTFTHKDDDVAYIWDNSFSWENGLCKMDLTFFLRSGKGYTRFDEVHLEKAYERELVKELLEQAGWKLKHVYDGYSERPAREESWRWLFVAENS